jgi:hypothetical protein
MNHATVGRTNLLVATLAALAASIIAGSGPMSGTLLAADDVLTRSRAMYAALRSYADSGVVIKEYGSSTKDRHTFTTAFNRAPRAFVLDFHKLGGGQYVIWGDPGAFHAWGSTTGEQYDYPNPDNTAAFNGSGQNTYSVGAKIPALLYAKARLSSDFANFADLTEDGFDDVAGRRCARVLGTARDVYAATGKEVNVRKMTVWIDAESLLIRKVVEQWKGLPGQISRVTTTYEPQANPSLEKSRLQFVPPAPR